MKKRLASFAVAAAFALPAGLAAQTFNGGLVGSCVVGTCGTSGADGDVTLSGLAGSTAYGYITTGRGSSGQSNGVGYGLSGDRLGSLWSFNFSTANPFTNLGFRFNYVSRDGGGFPDYAFAHLFDGDGNRTILFNARTQPDGNIIPGQGLPAPSPGVTLVPSTAVMNPGAPVWSVLGANETDGGALGTNCWAAGCGYTGWVSSLFTIAAAGEYRLELGVVNFNDNLFQSGLAFDFALSGGVPVDPVPEPTSLALLGLGLAGLGAVRRRRRQS